MWAWGTLPTLQGNRPSLEMLEKDFEGCEDGRKACRSYRDEGFGDFGEGRLYAQRILRLLSIPRLKVK